MGIVEESSFKSTDTIQAPGSTIRKVFLIDSILKCAQPKRIRLVYSSLVSF